VADPSCVDMWFAWEKSTVREVEDDAENDDTGTWKAFLWAVAEMLPCRVWDETVRQAVEGKVPTSDR